MLLRATVVALKLAVVAAAATVTEAGMVSVGLLLVRVTAAPPMGATWVRVIVQALEALGPRLVGLQTRDETSTAAIRLMVALAEVLLYAAVMVAL